MTGTWSRVVVARAAWSRLAEPGDLVAGALVGALGPVEALSWLTGAASAGASGEVCVARLPGLDGRTAGRLAAAVARWAPRLPRLDAEADLRLVERIGGRFVVPGAPGWPTRVDDLGASAPPGLWVRGRGDLDALVARSVALIGARACTPYGERVTAELSTGLAGRGWTVVSGGAFGIDAVAHRAALAVDGATVAFLAGGLDRPYPAGNARLLSSIVDQGGAVVCEVPPGSVPSKVRFLQRNRLIAAATGATVVVEAAWRSGALNTAGHAAALSRPVGTVPGPVTSAASAGCHRLLRDGAAVCVTDTDEVIELAGALGADLAPLRSSPTLPGDGLDQHARRTIDALPVRRGAPPEAVARVAGLSVPDVRSALGSLELAGLALQDGGLWRRTRSELQDPDRPGQLGRSGGA